MKRYDSDEEGVMRESKDGMWNLHSDLSAHMLKLKEVVEGMEHESGCHSHKHCGVAGCGKAPWVIYHRIDKPLYMHEFEPGRCDCRVGQASVLIGEAL